MTGAQKRTALLALAAEADRAGLGLIDAALTQIAGLDLDDAAVCAKWGSVCEKDTLRHGPRRRVLLAAAKVLRTVAP